MYFLIDLCTNKDALTIIHFFWKIIKLIFFIVPIIAIVMITLDFAKSVIASKEDEMKKNLNNVIKRIIYCVAVFLTPTIVSFTMNLLGETGTKYGTCLANIENGTMQNLTDTTNKTDKPTANNSNIINNPENEIIVEQDTQNKVENKNEIIVEQDTHNKVENENEIIAEQDTHNKIENKNEIIVEQDTQNKVENKNENKVNNDSSSQNNSTNQTIQYSQNNNVYFLSLKRGNAILLQSKIGNQTYYGLIDAGSDGTSNICNNLVKEIKVIIGNNEKLDFFLVSHLHTDHIGCANNILNNINVEQLFIKQYSGSSATNSYNNILKKDGRLEFKTDNRELFDFAVAELPEAGWLP